MFYFKSLFNLIDLSSYKINLKYLKYIFFIFILYNINVSIGQQIKYHLNLSCTTDKHYFDKYNYEKNFTDSLSVIKELNHVIYFIQQKGYLSASIDCIIFDSTSVNASIYLGYIYKYGMVNYNNIDESTLRKLKIKTNKLSSRYLDITKLNTINNKLLTYYENNGYPFASIKADTIKFNTDTININYKLNKNILITIDSIIINGNVKISNKYICQYLSISSGDLYNEKKLKNIKSLLNELVFIQEDKPYQIIFKKDKVDLMLYLKNKKANQFNGIIGILPNNKTTGKTIVTGDLNLLLLNSFGKGETFWLNWQQLEPISPHLKTKINYPFLFSTQFGVDGNFTLYKKDSAYININTNIGIQYLLMGSSYFKAYYDNKKSSLISTKAIENTTVLPTICDFQTNLFGFSYNFEQFDYKYNPYKGFSFNINFGVGKKIIIKNPKLNPSIYNNVKLNTAQYEGLSNIMVFVPVTDKTTIKLQNKSGLIDNPNLFENELYRIGGYNTLRGFDEESIYASSYTVFTIEYRFIFERNSCMFIFADGAYYEKNTKTLIHDSPYGVGLGIDFETKAGIFSISYAIGKQFDNPIEIRSAKIHIGYVNRF